nr:immunoglobulin heavy chain junction region [Macaca mulatta]MOV38684.1 immunoglobulin heavy chain junction region [Macaca mulatta]MOV41730.1 immunoglobulin heavy chain junction region [Macaca mulatta]MOV42105.1 immunoglobulin heavy chain junction region [Macaca mulatta]MOV42108.1 immunoglobulin heavy chain junction region [Macaca mulatta]
CARDSAVGATPPESFEFW